MTMEIELEEGLDLNLDDLGQPTEIPLEWNDDDTNLVATFSQSEKGQKELVRISNKMVDSFDDEWEAQENMRSKIADNWKFFLADLKNKTFPFENCANLNVPIAYENIVRLAFRIYGELFGDWVDPVGVIPVGPDDEETALLKSKHTNYQMTEVIKDFPSQMFKAILMFLYDGDIAAHSFYDPVMRSNRHVVLDKDQFVTPNNVNSLMPDYSTAPWTCEIQEYSSHQLERMRGIWFGVDEILDKKYGSDTNEPESELKNVVSQVIGVEEPDDPIFKTYKILLWTGWMDMPNDTKLRYVQAYIHYDTRKLLQLTIHEQAPYDEITRYRREEASLEAYKQELEQYNTLSSKVKESRDRFMENPDVDDETKMQYSIGEEQLPPPPIPPMWLDKPLDPQNAKPKEMRKQPIYQYTHGTLIAPRKGTIGHGFGQLVSDLNRAANTLIDQFIDAGTVANTNEMITTSEIEFEKPFKSRPGAIHVIKNATAADLRNSIMPLPKGNANPQLMEVLRMAIDWGHSAPQSPELLSGAPGKSGETARGLLNRSEHATKQLSTIARKFAEFVTTLYKQNARLNSVFLDEEEFFNVNNKKLGMMQNLKIGRAMYRGVYDVVWRSDMTFTTEAEKIQKADELVQLYMTIPLLQQNPEFGKKVIVKALEARGQNDLAELIRNTPLQPPALPPVAMAEQEGPPNVV